VSIDKPTRPPDGWILRWCEGGQVAPPEARSLLPWTLPPGVTGVARLFQREGLAAFGGGSFPLGPCELAFPAFPAFDDVVTLWALARSERGVEATGLDALARYAEDVRQGRWPDAQPVDRAVQAVYLALAQHHLLREAPERARFVEEAFAFLDHLASRLAEGARLADDDLVSGAPSLRRYVALLEKDRDLYAEDRRRSLRFRATIPGEATWTGAAREVALLAIERPAATQFKLWARRDPLASGGKGYALLAVKHARGWALLSADPDQKLRVGWLEQALTEAERAARGRGEAAWSGARYEGTVCESPADGTRLSIPQIVDAVRKPLRLRPERRPVPRVAALGAAAGIACALAAVTWVAVRPDCPPDMPNCRGATVVDDPSPTAGVATVTDADIARRVDRALVIGGDKYDRWPELHNAEGDAKEVARLLPRFGFQVEHVPRPSNEEFSKLVTKYATMAYGPADQLLVYVAGHGFFDPVARQGFLIFRDSGPSHDITHARSYNLDALRKAFEGAGARHVLLVLDTCFGGTIDDAIAKRAGVIFQTNVQLREQMRNNSRLVITSAGRRETEDGPPGGHSPFAERFLEMLRQSPKEQGAFISVNELVAHLDKNTPRPYYGRFGNEADRGYASFVLQWAPPPASESPGATPTPR
jgi:hypothetical protein